EPRGKYSSRSQALTTVQVVPNRKENDAMVSDEIKTMLRSIFRAAMTNPMSRRALNYGIDLSPLTWKRRVHGEFGLTFKDYNADWIESDWRFNFMGKNILIPLQKSTLNTDWITAVTIMGHDIEEKRTYMNILASDMKPDLFIDVGGNFGTHSLLMLSQGVSVMYVEPNETCHVHFRRYCERNSFSCALELCALGAAPGEAKLRFPIEETWLGSTKEWAALNFQGTAASVMEIAVPVRTLDELCGRVENRKVSLKIDAEGSERDILTGGRETIFRLRPVVVFECHKTSGDRAFLADFFDEFDYDIYSQPWSSAVKFSLNADDFSTYPHHNFVAVPRIRS
ncbi:MAG: FkbM family methyltransferase, partial [Blastocatellia bacterium]|nr:FkbM family methyltransferase [Blastocatellia bacterium]